MSFVTVEQQEEILSCVKDYINAGKPMEYAYPNGYPYLSTKWLSSIENDVNYEHVITPQEDTIYIVQNIGSKKRFPVLYDRSIRLYRILDAHDANEFTVRTLSEENVEPIPSLSLAKTTTVTTQRTHFQKVYNKGDVIRVYFDFDLYSMNNRSWLHYATLVVTLGQQSFNYQMEYDPYLRSYPKTFDRTFEISEDNTELKILIYKKTGDCPYIIKNGQIVEYTSHYNDYETDEFVPATDTKDGIAGKIPGIASGSEMSVFMSDGKWHTLTELKTLLDSMNNTDGGGE